MPESSTLSMTLSSLQEQFAQVLGAVLLPDTYTAPSIARVAGTEKAPTKDTKVEAEVLRSAHMICEIERNSEAIEARINALRAKKAQADHLAEMLRGDVRDMLLQSGVKSVRDVEIIVSLRKNPDKLTVGSDVETMEILHPEFIRTKKEIDKAAINKFYKETGELIDGAEVVTGGHTVQIKK